MNYDEHIDLLEKEQRDIELRILDLIEKRAAQSIDLNHGDQVAIISTDAIAVVDECYAKAENFHGDRCVEIIVKCHTRSGKQYVLQRYEVEKI